MISGDRVLSILKNSLCKKCFEKHQDWSNEIYSCWKKYIGGATEKEIIKDTHFTRLVSVMYHFRKHICYKKISSVRRRWLRPVKTHVIVSPKEFPWLLGLFYADGSIHDGTQLSFGLAIHEKIIENRVVQELKQILGNSAHIVTETVGNMRNVRTHSVELCDKLPSKNNDKEFLKLWEIFTTKKKLEFIGGLIDGDGSCSFEDGINSIHLFSRLVPFILNPFKSFLSKYGYVSLTGNELYISPKVGFFIKKFTLKKDIKKPYLGGVNVNKAFSLLKNGISVYKISKIIGFNKKTILIALKRVYGKRLIQKYFDKNRLKRINEYSGKYDLKHIFNLLKKGHTLNSIIKKEHSHSHVKQCLIKVYGKERIEKYIRKTKGKSKV